MLERGDARWRYALSPVTGRKHQLRVHLSALRAPIENDRVYPRLVNVSDVSFSQPLQLLAKRLVFVDPMAGEDRAFESRLTLQDVSP